jgi:hypothetical protein
MAAEVTENTGGEALFSLRVLCDLCGHFFTILRVPFQKSKRQWIFIHQIRFVICLTAVDD